MENEIETKTVEELEKLQKRKEASKRYYEKNKEKIYEYQKKYLEKLKTSDKFEAFQEKRKAAQKKYYQKNSFKRWANRIDELKALIDLQTKKIDKAVELRKKWMDMLLKVEEYNDLEKRDDSQNQ